LSEPLESIEQWPDDVPVNFFDGLDLGVGFPLVRGLVRSLDMHTNQVEAIQRLDACFSFSAVIGVEISCRAWNVDPLPAQKHANPPHEVDGANNGPGLSVRRREGQQLWSLAQPPKPNLSGLFAPSAS